MTVTVMHQPRIAWDASRTLVDVVCSDVETFAWYRDRVADLLGAACREQLLATRARLENPLRDDAVAVEAGLWRVRFEDELRTHADLTEGLHLLTMAARRRAAPVEPVRAGLPADAPDSTDDPDDPYDGDLGVFRLG
ncbi:MAG: hypothetical protein HOV87_29415 [Catenulispora sp.]|nr:hypothetical protein [Catenulispora sp.]